MVGKNLQITDKAGDQNVWKLRSKLCAKTENK